MYQRATTCARVIVKNWVCRFGVPDSIHSDQGRNFESGVFSEMCKMLQMKKSRSTAYHPQGNGQIENVHRTLKNMLMAMLDEQTDRWDEYLDFCMMAYRSSIHVSTGHTPFELMFGREMRIPIDVMMGERMEDELPENSYSQFVGDLRRHLVQAYHDVRKNLQAAQRRQKDTFDKGVCHMSYKPGDLVLRYSPQLKPGEAKKFHRNWEGPYVVIDSVTEITYRIKKTGSKRSLVVHYNNLRLYKKSEESNAPEETETGNDASIEQSAMEEEWGTVDYHDDCDGFLESNNQDSKQDEIYNSASSTDEAVVPQLQTTCNLKDHRNTGAYNQDTQTTNFESTVEIGSNDEVSECQGEESSDEDSASEAVAVEKRHLPARERRPPDRYGDWVINNLQISDLLMQIDDRIRTMERHSELEQERIAKLKPKMLKKARQLRNKLLRGH